ncbi:MAG: M20/M25/M40 family metallo-hydrolase [Ardenticatenaceae bacterium]|nr:M20/M25/M40 family metallo-hydrolase [Ardenticatenaceae bacterium]
MDRILERLLGMAEEATGELVELHQALVRIPTVNTGARDSGNEIEACRLLEERFQAEGISTLTLESAPSRGNLLASIGDQPKPRLLLMSHLDVVPVEDESRWKLPPFSGTVVDGKVYGRGSDDAKSLASTGAMTLILLKRAGISLRGELRFLAAADEEAGGRYGIGWLAQAHPDQIRASWAINEGGGMPLKRPEGLAYFISIGEKGRMEARFTLRGRSAHGARPWLADNALYKLARLLQRIESYRPEIDVSLPTFHYFHHFGIAEKPISANLDRLLAGLGQQNSSLATTLTALSRMSIAPTMASAGIKSNSIPASAELIADVRTLPHQDEAYVRHELEKITAGLAGVDLELDVTAIANASSFESPFVAQVQRATKLALDRGEIELIPSLTVGFTDSRCVRPLGTEVYGFAPLVPETDMIRSGVHGVDETMEIENLVLRTKMQVALAYLTLGGPQG